MNTFTFFTAFDNFFFVKPRHVILQIIVVYNVRKNVRSTRIISKDITIYFSFINRSTWNLTGILAGHSVTIFAGSNTRQSVLSAQTDPSSTWFLGCGTAFTTCNLQNISRSNFDIRPIGMNFPSCGFHSRSCGSKSVVNSNF